MSDSSARLALPYILPAQAQKHVTHNEAIERLDVLVQMTVEDFSASTPPAQPADGAVWALNDAPSGEWSGQGGKLAARTNGGWLFISPQPGWVAAQGAELRIWDGTAWVSLAQSLPDTLPGLGINTSHDATNRLAVAADATLLSHDGGGHQLKLNKLAAAETASLMFQTDWAGRAEMGTVGNDQFQIKVSADGTAWHTALQANAATGGVVLPNGAQCNGSFGGTAVVQGNSDTTAGRLLTTGAGPAQAFRQGNILGNVALAGGVPSGAIIQRGSNANGEFVRFADGTQICWRYDIPITGLSGNSHTEDHAYPASFSHLAVAMPVLDRSVGSWASSDDRRAFVTSFPSTSQARILFLRDGGTNWAGTRGRWHYTAIGRWV